MSNMSELFLTPTEVAERWHIKRATLANWRYQGKGPTYIKLGRTVRYPLSAI